MIQRNRLSRSLVFSEGFVRGGEVFGIFARFQLGEVFDQRNDARGPFFRKGLQFRYSIGNCDHAARLSQEGASVNREGTDIGEHRHMRQGSSGRTSSVGRYLSNFLSVDSKD